MEHSHEWTIIIATFPVPCTIVYNIYAVIWHSYHMRLCTLIPTNRMYCVLKNSPVISYPPSASCTYEVYASTMFYTRTTPWSKTFQHACHHVLQSWDGMALVVSWAPAALEGEQGTAEDLASKWLWISVAVWKKDMNKEKLRRSKRGSGREHYTYLSCSLFILKH